MQKNTDMVDLVPVRKELLGSRKTDRSKGVLAALIILGVLSALLAIIGAWKCR